MVECAPTGGGQASTNVKGLAIGRARLAAVQAAAAPVHRWVKASALIAALAAPVAAAAPQASPWRDEITVTASRLGDAAPGRRLLTLQRDEIAALPVRTVAELVAYLAGGGVVRRGTHGIQTDAQFRGSTFEQVAVLIDGVRVNDPQTGHFHLDIPIPLEVIERVDVLLGPGGAVHGPDAFGAVIALTTGHGGGAQLQLRGGEYGLGEGRATAAFPGGWLAAHRSRCDGFAPNTDFSIAGGALGSGGQVGLWRWRATAAAEDKKFGAWAFYSQRFPMQYEEVGTATVTAVAHRPLGGATATVRTALRQHRDHFVLDRPRPQWYVNRHRSRGATAHATLTGATAGWHWAAGTEAGRETLRSTRLGNRDRSRFALFGEGSRRVGRFTGGVQLRWDHLQGQGWQSTVGAGGEWELADRWSAAAFWGQSFRLPSFTDRYYDSPTTVGREDLAPERGHTAELLLRGPAAGGWVEAAVFTRRARDLIDYVRDDDGLYRATNHAAVRTRGVELALQIPRLGPLTHLRGSVGYLHSQLDLDPARSRYALSQPRWEGTLSTAVALPWEVRAAVGVRARRPRDRGGYLLAEVRLERALSPALGMEVSVSNLFDRSVEEIPGVPLPGRWATLALSWRQGTP